MIPRRLIRIVPRTTTDEVEQFWRTAGELHLDWGLVTYRDPIDPSDFPLSAADWPRCRTGAQLAGVVRLEALLANGGIYIDSDVELYRSLEPLRESKAFAAWEDAGVVPDAVLGAEPEHPAIKACLDLALERLRSDDIDWRTGNGAWSTGPGVTTAILPGRDDVTLLPPASFYPYHYTEKHRRHEDHRHQGGFGAHHWAGSWL